MYSFDIILLSFRISKDYIEIVVFCLPESCILSIFDWIFENLRLYWWFLENFIKNWSNTWFRYRKYNNFDVIFRNSERKENLPTKRLYSIKAKVEFDVIVSISHSKTCMTKDVYEKKDVYDKRRVIKHGAFHFCMDSLNKFFQNPLVSIS